MNKLLTILLVEDEPMECGAFIDCADYTDDVCLVGVTDDANKALELVKDCFPDAIILDLELHKGSGNGISFLTELHNARLAYKPYILVTTNNVSQIVHGQTRRLGADFIIHKSQADYSAESVIEFLRSAKEDIHSLRIKTQSAEPAALPPGEIRKRMMARANAEIDRIGISPKAIGRIYLVEAIILNADNQSDFIKTIAQKHGKTDASVERAMQNAINRAWRHADCEDLEKYYTAIITSDKGVPTLTEFICHYSNKIKSEYHPLVAYSSKQT